MKETQEQAAPLFEWARGRIYWGNALTILTAFGDNSVDSIVTDPPYEIGFMGKAWDRTGVAFNVSLWRECLRILKPGGHLLAFGGARTYHRMAAAVDDAGFEIRDQIMWLYGSGFPKSLDVSKAIDKAAGAERKLTRPGKVKRDGYFDGWDTGSSETRPRYDAPATPAAAAWDGWGTALKPAHEPIVVARKQFPGTVAHNVMKYGTGAINIDGCRIPTDDNLGGGKTPPLRFEGENARPFHSKGRDGEASAERRYHENGATNFAATPGPRGGDAKGRWPANLIHDGSEEVLDAFAQYGEDKGAAAPVTLRNADKFRKVYGTFAGMIEEQHSTFHGDIGTAARFFYCAKATREDRDRGCEDFEKRPLNWSNGEQSPGTFQSAGTERNVRNNHATVKPVELMRYLCRLVTPPGGTVLDPLMGSGSTGKAAMLEGLHFIGIELDERTCHIAERRMREMSFLWQ